MNRADVRRHGQKQPFMQCSLWKQSNKSPCHLFFLISVVFLSILVVVVVRGVCVVIQG